MAMSPRVLPNLRALLSDFEYPRISSRKLRKRSSPGSDLTLQLCKIEPSPVVFRATPPLWALSEIFLTQWHTHTRCVRCVRTPCENFNFWYMKFSNLSLKICVPIILKSLKSLKAHSFRSVVYGLPCTLCTVRRTLPGA